MRKDRPSSNGPVEGVEARLAGRRVPRRIAKGGQRGTKWTIGEFVWEIFFAWESDTL